MSTRVRRDVELTLGELPVVPSRGRPRRSVAQADACAPPSRPLLARAFVLAAAVAGTTMLMVPGPTAAVAQVTTTTPSEPTTVPPPTTTVPPTTTLVTAPPPTAPPPTAPRPTAPPSPSAVTGGARPRRTTPTAPVPRAATTSPGPTSTVDASAVGAIQSLAAPATTIVDPSSSTSAPRSSAAPRRVAAAFQTRGRSLASLWWPGALAVAVGALSIVGGRRIRPAPVRVDLDAETNPDVLVDLERAEREAHAPAERMAMELERLRATAPPVNGRRHRSH